MNTQPIGKLPGSKKEFPFVKAKIDNKKPASMAIPVSSATKPADLNPKKSQLKPTHTRKADVAPLMPKIGFGHRGFGSTSITAVIPKHQIIRPSAVHQDKKIHPRDWNSSTKIELSCAKKTFMKDLKPEPFRANPVPKSHYDEPFRPVLPSKKVRITATAKKEKSLESTTNPGLVNRAWHLVIDPIWHPDNGESPAGKVITPDPEEKEEVLEISAIDVRDEEQPTAENTDPSAYPRLATWWWHKMLDPIIHPTKSETDQTLVDGELEENQPEDQKEVEVVEGFHLLEVDIDTSKVPEKAQDQPIAEIAESLPSRIWHSVVDPVIHPKTNDEKEVTSNGHYTQEPIEEEITVESAPITEDDKFPTNPEAVLDPTGEDVEALFLPQEVEPRLKTETATGNQLRRRHVKRRRHSESHLTKPIDSKEEPVNPGLLRRAVVDISSTAWSAGKSVLSGVGSMIGLGGTSTPDFIPYKSDNSHHKKHWHHEKKSLHEHLKKE